MIDTAANMTTTFHTNDRRITDILTHYWEHLKNGSSLPLASDIKPTDIADIWEHCFLVQLEDIKNKENYHFTYFGNAIQRAYAEDLTDSAVKYLVSPHAEHLAELYAKVLKTKKPLVDEGQYRNRDLINVMYRQCLLPIASDNDPNKIGFILGGMRYKLKP